jgi:hypothetical protein
LGGAIETDVMKSWLIENNLAAVRRRWKWLEFGRRVGTAGSFFCLGWFLVQLAAWTGVLASPALYHVLIGLAFLAAPVVLVVIFLRTEANREKRSWIANALETSCPPLLDRVNTLVYLEENPSRARSFRLKERIEDQAAKVIETEKRAAPFSPNRTLLHLAVFALLLAGVVFFQHRFDPFRDLVAQAAVPAPKGQPFELAPQKTVTETEPRKAWGEVRIVDPGHDVKLTKVDVLPLQIEMTTSDTMTAPAWVSSVDGDTESVHELAAPADPNYMVYQPLIYLDQLKVTEWDVVSYYAQVKSDAPAEYASPISFIEIRPFREDILKLTGGKGNKRYDLLSEITGLIKQQTVLIQQTHQHQETVYAHDEQRMQDAHKLSQGEDELATATNHFFGKIAAESENTPVGDILDELSQAGQQMNRATQSLKDDVATEGRLREQGALTHLIATRKAFRKTISDHPDAFDGGSTGDLADQPPVTATQSLQTLAQVSEMRDRDQAALQALHQLVERQQALAQAPGSSAALATHQQVKVNSDLRDLTDQNRDLFRGSETEESAVQQDMMQSILKLSSGDLFSAKPLMGHVADGLKQLENAVARNHESQQLAQAYQLRKIIDQNTRQLGQEQAKPGSLSDQEVKDLAASARRSTSTLKDIVDNDTAGSFGPQLGQSLSAGNQQALDSALGQFGHAPAGPARGAAAGQAQGNLQGISHIFDQSQPALTGKIRGQDQLQPPPADALDQATQELQSMLMAAGAPHPGSGADQAKAMSQALDDLHAGLSDAKFGAAGGAQVLADADKLLKEKIPGSSVDPEALKKLLDEIEAARIEANDAGQPKPPDAETTQVDPSKFPPAYRDRLRTYFEQLSQQPSH